MNEQEIQVALRRARTFLLGIGYDVAGVSDERLGQALSTFLGTLRGFGAQVQDGTAGAAGVRSESIGDLLKQEE